MDFLILIIFTLLISISGSIIVIKNENRKEKKLIEKRNDRIRKEFVELYNKEKLNNMKHENISISYKKDFKQEYKEYLKSDHWKEMKNKALERADNKCQLCSSKINLNVHHNTYKNKGHENLTDLVVLCRECHAKFHNKLP